MLTPRALLATAALTLALAGTAAPAHATERNSVCESGELCLYWGSNLSGAVADYGFSRRDFASDRYVIVCCTWRAGMGELVKNNAASAANTTYMHTARVYYNENHTGPYDDVLPGRWRNLANTFNDNASFRWLVPA